MGRRREEGVFTLVSLVTTMRAFARQIQFATAPCNSSEVFQCVCVCFSEMCAQLRAALKVTHDVPFCDHSDSRQSVFSYFAKKSRCQSHSVAL